MNNKGLKYRIYICEECLSQITFKSYSSDHRFCNNQCAASFKAKQHWAKQRTAFNEGKLSTRSAIYRLLVERDGNKCSVCNITDWNGKSIRFWVDHIDGNATNNAPTNFRLICPNCDSQSETFGARNKGNGRKSRGLPSYG